MLRVTTMIALIAAVAGDNHAKSDYWYHEHADVTNAVWVFAPDGVKMFSPDGTEIKSLPHPPV
jgi:hypothetical protein